MTEHIDYAELSQLRLKLLNYLADHPPERWTDDDTDYSPAAARVLAAVTEELATLPDRVADESSPLLGKIRTLSHPDYEVPDGLIDDLENDLLTISCDLDVLA